MTDKSTGSKGGAGDTGGTDDSGGSDDQGSQTNSPPDRPSVVEPTETEQRDGGQARPKVVESTVKVPAERPSHGQFVIGPSQPLNDPDQ